MSTDPVAPHPPWFDPAMPSREDCVLRHMLEVRARRSPQRLLAIFEDGVRWTYAEGLAKIRTAAAALQKLGVRRGDRVLAWLPDCRGCQGRDERGALRADRVSDSSPAL